MHRYVTLHQEKSAIPVKLWHGLLLPESRFSVPVAGRPEARFQCRSFQLSVPLSPRLCARRPPRRGTVEPARGHVKGCREAARAIRTSLTPARPPPGPSLTRSGVAIGRRASRSETECGAKDVPLRADSTCSVVGGTRVYSKGMPSPRKPSESIDGLPGANHTVPWPAAPFAACSPSADGSALDSGWGRR